MLLTFIAAIVLGAAAVGGILMCFRVFGRKPPKGVTVLAAGAAMFGFMIWTDYSWYGRTQSALPKGFFATASQTTSHWAKPWTLASAPIDRFVAVDGGSIRRKPDSPDLRLVELHLLTRHRPTLTVRQIHDCASARRLDVGDAAALDAGPNAKWIGLPQEDTVHATVCAINVAG